MRISQSSKDKSNYAVVHLGALGIFQKKVWAFKSSEMMAQMLESRFKTLESCLIMEAEGKYSVLVQ